MALLKKEITLLLLLVSCSGLSKGEEEHRRRLNAKGEVIYRNHQDVRYTVDPIKPQVQEPYPWDKE